jgi:ATP-dependent DNA helicase RecQ
MLNYDGGGESPETPCCDVCDKNASTALREEFTVWDFIRRNKRRYKLYEVSAILAESKIHHWSEGEAKQVINYLIKTGRIKKTRNFFWGEALTVM